MQLLILALFLSLYLHDEMPSLIRTDTHWLVLLAWVVGAKFVLAGVYATACRFTAARLSSGGASRRLLRLELVGSVFRVGTLVLWACDLHLGLLVWVRRTIHGLTGITQPILFDELLTMLPTLVLWGIGWGAYYPVERRLREASLMRQIDQGQPIYAIWSRWQYILAQYRYQVALILLPLVAVIAWTESIEFMAGRGTGWINMGSQTVWITLGCIGIFMCAPVLIRLAWGTVPLPDGEVRDHLLAMCRRHRVRIGELLMWRTYGGMINAAVLGFISPLRYILITDGLLQQMPRHHVEAVMAHELAHVRKRHMVWLLLSALALMGVVEVAALVFLANNGLDDEALNRLLSVPVDASGAVLTGPALGSLGVEHAWLLGTLVCAALIWALGFGWVSRRAERQADSFAVAHLAAERGDNTINATDAQTMIDALQHLADLNHVRADKHSWRHGSIKWRQDYLRSLDGIPINSLAIDRLMRWVNAASLAALAAVVMLHRWHG